MASVRSLFFGGGGSALLLNFTVFTAAKVGGVLGVRVALIRAVAMTV